MDFLHRQPVRRPANEVFDFVADFENNPRWQAGMEACRWTSETRFEVGSTYDQEARFLGRPILTSFVVTDYAPGRSISIESTKS
ncbi:MAG: SRPBCC family protein, partial [Myxococcota bacterium]